MGQRVIFTIIASVARTEGVLGLRLIWAHSLIPLKRHDGEISRVVGVGHD